MSDLRVQIDELQHKLKDIDEEKGQLKKYYVQRLEQQQTHMDQYWYVWLYVTMYVCMYVCMYMYVCM